MRISNQNNVVLESSELKEAGVSNGNYRQSNPTDKELRKRSELSSLAAVHSLSHNKNAEGKTMPKNLRNAAIYNSMALANENALHARWAAEPLEKL